MRQVWDDDSNGDHDLIGEVKVSVRELTMFNTTGELPIIDPKKEGKMMYKSSGVLQILEFAPVVGAPLLEGGGPPQSFVYPTGQSMYPGVSCTPLRCIAISSFITNNNRRVLRQVHSIQALLLLARITLLTALLQALSTLHRFAS